MIRQSNGNKSNTNLILEFGVPSEMYEPKALSLLSLKLRHFFSSTSKRHPCNEQTLPLGLSLQGVELCRQVRVQSPLTIQA